ncbi:protein Spindly-A [Xenopus laevis]|uniref:Protein Spindly-A n=1 Tax=Xenopus laevis TaxID=8355 RepID=SPDLA_XENLA|nr:protein Spindly-A [Xenopus laevis]Q5BIX7.1 RecName: Full=Protein Spindly-A; AltName: Full=Coiled-coil domain-containing protein 99-A; AltName: Full=Spindle apparatus coiled-coil domain-containing protein 1-A [Xenopus laevis]AAH91716.1 MGC85118 protein [Xenopus laevis]
MEESETVLKLRRQLKEAEEERVKAAHYGLELLESQSDLQNQLEEQRNEMTGTIENLEQEKYSLQREVELKNRMLESVTSECENIRQQQKLILEQLQEQLERNHHRELGEIKDKLEKLKAELDEARLSEKQLKHKLEYQTEVLANKSEELRMMSERVHETMSSEMLTLQLEKTELESAKANLEQEVNELQYREQQLLLTNGTQSRKLEHLQTEKEEREKESVGYFSALEKAREANQDLQAQLDIALQQAQDPNSKGNSLFSEVEDRRAEMERQLISMKVQFQSLQKQHAFSRQQMHRMKVQIATLLQMKGSQSDPEQLERLQAMVAQKNSEIEALVMKVRQLEKSQQVSENGPAVGSSDNLGQGDETYYVDLLKMKLLNSSKENEKIKDELSLQRMKALAESQRVLELERKLFANDRHLKLSQGENMKLRVSLDEIKMKYEPDEMGKIHTQKRRKEQLPLDFPMDNTSAAVTSGTEAQGLYDATAGETCTAESTDGRIHSKEDLSLSTKEQDPSSVAVKPKELPNGPPPKERKRVRIMEDENNAQDLNKRNTHNCSVTSASPRSTSEDATSESKRFDEEQEKRKQERKSRLRAPPVLHVPSKPNATTQCPQQ